MKRTGRTGRYLQTAWLVWLGLLVFPVRAQEWVPSGSLVLTHQTAHPGQIASETLAQGSLRLRRGTAASAWTVHVQAATTPDPSGVSRRLPEVNAVVGAGLGADDHGRVQLSELFHSGTLAPGRVLSVGYLDISGYFEQSRIASDETTQFMGASFTGNPTIEFPDYTLGGVYEHALASGPVLRLGLSSSNGLADNPARSYSQLLSVHSEGKGYFAIASVSLPRPRYLLRLGGWVNTADHDALDGSAGGLRNQGGYMLLGLQRDRHAMNVRYGMASAQVSRASSFASLGYQYRVSPNVLGLGMARSRLSDREPDRALGDTRHAEVYWRRLLVPGFFLTLDAQRLRNPGFGSSSELRGHALTVYGVRLTWLSE